MSILREEEMNIIEKIKLLFKLNSLFSSEVKEIKSMDIKSGWKTSEFWGKVAAQATVIWAAIGGFIPPKYAAIIVVAGEGVYTIGRTILKIVQTIQTAKSNQTTVTTTEPITTVTTPA